MKHTICFVTTLLFLFGCSGVNTPEGVLNKYINYRFSKDQDRDKLLAMTSGQLNKQLLEKDEAAFEEFAQGVRDLKKKKFSIILKKCDEQKCYITYLISYDVIKEGSKKYNVEVKKIAELEKISGNWKVTDVNNLKTFIDSKESITP
ncbi:MAG: hypothetical protein ISR65_00445 [Bacteriovoracaceae bacterium]|nr:hypothetical protein [Bacteriovoracaceae bacterium]